MTESWAVIAPVLPELGRALGQTLLMLALSLSAALLFGLPLGVLLRLTDRRQPLARPWLFWVLNVLVNTGRSFPFVILMIALVPFTRLMTGTTIGPVAAAVPLSVAAVFFFARLVEQSLREVPHDVIEAAQSLGATLPQIVCRVLLPEARIGLVLGFTVLAVSLLSYSAIAGVVGGGGVGDLAIRYGYYRFQTEIMLVTVTVLILLVQLIQFMGNRIARRLDPR